MNKIAIIDPSSYTLPYDYFYINELAKHYKIDFYYSKTVYNYEYIDKLISNNNISLKEYNISPAINNKLMGLYEYTKLLKDILLNEKKYIKIHFMWSIFALLEIPLFLLIRHKLIFTFHNDVPHTHGGNTYFPYKMIKKIAKKIIFVSGFTQHKFSVNYGVSKKYSLLKHGIMPLTSMTQKTIKKTKNTNDIIFWGRVEEYKGVDLFVNSLQNHSIKIYGKWNKNISSLKKLLNKKSNIQIFDFYLPPEDLLNLLMSESIFIFPYKSSTQSGVLYTLLAYEKVFISSDVGENKDFLEDNGLNSLIFNRNDEVSINRSIQYARENYWQIKNKLKNIRYNYEWMNIMQYDKLKEIYE